jgi:hypothetical protein
MGIITHSFSRGGGGFFFLKQCSKRKPQREGGGVQELGSISLVKRRERIIYVALWG